MKLTQEQFQSLPTEPTLEQFTLMSLFKCAISSLKLTDDEDREIAHCWSQYGVVSCISAVSNLYQDTNGNVVYDCEIQFEGSLEVHTFRVARKPFTSDIMGFEMDNLCNGRFDWLLIPSMAI